jgi:hypothetical protein
VLTRVIAERDFEELGRWLDARSDDPVEWREAAGFGDDGVYLTAEELRELYERMRRLVLPFVERNERPELRPADARFVTVITLAFPSRGERRRP